MFYVSVEMMDYNKFFRRDVPSGVASLLGELADVSSTIPYREARTAEFY